MRTTHHQPILTTLLRPIILTIFLIAIQAVHHVQATSIHSGFRLFSKRANLNHHRLSRAYNLGRRAGDDFDIDVDDMPVKCVLVPRSASSSADNSSSTSGSGSNSGAEVCTTSGAVDSITATAGPNGDISYFDCGINTVQGWNPPQMTIADLVSVNLSTALNASSSSPFQACDEYISLFEKHAEQNDLPAIMIASFALQESSCQPNTTGEGGEQGIMQISQDKCTGAPDGNCKDPDFNIGVGAKFFADTLKNNNGNVIQSIGQYNGWFVGMTFADATKDATSSCCRCQNNLDYLQQYLNGWIQNINPITHNPPLGKYFNLNACNNN